MTAKLRGSVTVHSGSITVNRVIYSRRQGDPMTLLHMLYNSMKVRLYNRTQGDSSTETLGGAIET
jgi:hypothetical protein